MQGDFALNPTRNHPDWTRVLMQQGRVLLPSDWNDLVQIMLQQIRGLATSIIGPHGGQEGAFQISVDANKIVIGTGRYWVNGILVRIGTETGEPMPFAKQPYFEAPDELPNTTGMFYLDVWERHLSSSEEPWLREIALGGPDTSSRTVVVWQVKFVAVAGAKPTKDAAMSALFKALAVPNLLRARAKYESDETEPCTISPDAQYRGPENQLYRVEIQDVEKTSPDGPVPAKFVWSRDNGSIVFPIEKLTGDTVKLGSLGNDRRTSLSPRDWVQVADDDTAYYSEPQPLLRVKSVDRSTMTVKLESPVGNLRGTDRKRRPILRKWDAPPADVTIGSGDTGWLDLEQGVQIQFAKNQSPDAKWRVGDYWLIPARTVSGDVMWPREEDGTPVFSAPQGVRHHLAPLAWWNGTGALDDLRKTFKPLAK